MTVVTGSDRCENRRVEAIFQSVFQSLSFDFDCAVPFARGQSRKQRMSWLCFVFGDTADFLFQMTSVNVCEWEEW